MHGMHRLNRMFFFLFSGRGRKPLSHGYHERQARMAAALDELRRPIHGLDDDTVDIAGSRTCTDRSGPDVLEQSQEQRPAADRTGSAAGAGGENSIVIGQHPNWETLEQRLLEMTEDNPDLSEVELKDE